MDRWSLRLRVFLIFAGLAEGLVLLIGLALLVAASGLDGQAGVTDALALAGLIAGLGGLGRGDRGAHGRRRGCGAGGVECFHASNLRVCP